MPARPPKPGSKPAPAPRPPESSAPRTPPEPGRPGPPTPRHRRLLSARNILALGAILVLTFLVYTPTLDNDFTNWDDDVYVTDNAFVRNPHDLAAYFSTPLEGNWHPLTMYSLVLDYARYRDHAPGYHLTNVLFHLLNTALVFVFVWLLGGSRFWTSALTALLFGIHPMHVESVAWISARKDVLYTCFYLLALIAYVPYATRPRVWLLAVCLVSFGLSLASKPAAVVLPLSLLAVDYFMRRPWSWRWIVEKIPFFGLSLWVGWLTMQAQTEAGAVGLPTRWSLFQKLLFASHGIMMYMVKLFWPFRLSAIYPYPNVLNRGIDPVFYLALPVVVLAVAALLRYGRGNRPLMFGAAFFFLNVMLVLQFFTVGQAVMADRYTYVPYIGLAIALTWWLDDRRAPSGRTLRPILAAVVAVVAAISLWQTPVRCEVWKNSGTLWNDVIAKFPERIVVAYNNRAYYYRSTGQFDRELAEYNHALALDPAYDVGWSNRGTALARMGDYAGALRDFDAAIRINPRYANAYQNRAVALGNLKRYEEAMADFRKVLELRPGDAGTTAEIGVLYLRMDRPRDALAEFDRAIALNPNLGAFYFNRSLAWERLGDRARALEDARRAQSLGVSGGGPDRIEQLSR